MTKTFAQRIAAMNAMYKLPARDNPALPEDVVGRLTRFKATLLDEVHEIDEIVAAAQQGAPSADILVAMADLLGDVIVYCRSEALKYGLTSSWTAMKASWAPTASRFTTPTENS